MVPPSLSAKRVGQPDGAASRRPVGVEFLIRTSAFGHQAAPMVHPRTPSAPATAVLSLLLVAGCGGGGDSATPSPSDSAVVADGGTTSDGGAGDAQRADGA